jgi:hypothetical protein
MIRLPDLETMDRAALVAAWCEVFGAPAPKGISRTHLRRFLAYEIQARDRGGVSKAVLAVLKRADSTGQAKVPPQGLRPGGRLLREWNGVTHVIDVTETGFLWKGEARRSLSSIAREITGAHWSGPRFFGLTGRRGA